VDVRQEIHQEMMGHLELADFFGRHGATSYHRPDAIAIWQYAAVTSPRGPALVLAGAGSGKTRTLTYRVAWLLHQGAKPWDILLLTFTNKSAKEMLERVEDLTGVPRGQFWGGTFHSIGQRILRRNALASLWPWQTWRCVRRPRTP
jgi:superfamily I DNA/RNA helicase